MKAPRRTRSLPSRTRRALAGTVDLGVGLLGAVALIATGLIDVSRWIDGSPDLPMLEHIAVELYSTRAQTAWTWVGLWTPFVVYHAVCGVLRRATIGATLTGLLVVGTDGHAASAGQGLFRGIAYLLWPLTGLLAAAWSFVSPSQRGFHDLVARAWVIRDPALLHSRTAE